MGRSDLTLRKKAIPFIGQVHGYNSNGQSNQNVTATAEIGDLYELSWQGAGNSQRYFPIRLLRPQASHMLQAYLSIMIQIGSSGTVPGPTPIKLFVGAAPFQADKFSTASVDIAKIKQQHAYITGSTDPITVPNNSRLDITGLNISSILSNDPASVYYSDRFFGLGLYFEDPPAKDGGWKLMKFKVDASANMGGL